MVVFALIHNLALLVALSVVSGFVEHRWRDTPRGALLQGLLFGGVAVVGMLNPFVLGPGLIFDGRSVVVSLCGLFFGPLAALTAGGAATICRGLQGGVGAVTGTLVILASALWGVGFHRHWTRRGKDPAALELGVFGLLVHGTMLLLMLTLPGGVGKTVLERIGLPVLVAYPLGTVLLGRVLSDQRSRGRLLRELQEERGRLHSYLDGAPMGIFLADQGGRCVQVNPEACRVTGYDEGELLGRDFTDLLVPESREMGMRCYEELRSRGRTSGEVAFRTKEGEVRWWSLAAVRLEEDRFLGYTQDVTDRVRAERAFREGEQRLRLALQASGIGLYDLDCRTGEVSVSREYVAMLGYDPASFRETVETWRERLHPEDRERAERIFRDYLSGARRDYRQEFRLRTASGEWKWILSSGRILERDPQGRPLRMLGTHEDVTSQKRTSEVLRAVAESAVAPGEDIFRFLVRHLALSLNRRYAMICRIDPEDPARAVMMAFWKDGVFMPPVSYPLAGTPSERVLREGEFFLPAGAVEAFPSDPPLAELGIESLWGLCLRSPEGGVLGLMSLLDSRPLEEDPGARALLHSFASRAAAELARRRSEEKYEALFRTMLDGFAVHQILCDPQGNPVDYRFLEVNPAFERLTGLRASEVVGRTVREVLPQTEDSWIRTYGRVALTGEPAHFENYAEALDRYFEVTAFRPRTGQFACLFVDITERRRAEEVRVRLEEQVRQSQKMDSIGRLAGGVAHDLNNLLTPILGYGELLEEEWTEPGSGREAVEEILRAGRRARDLVAQLLAFGRKQVLEFRSLDLNETLRGFERLLRRTIREDVRVDYRLRPDLPRIRGDAGQLEQVILNLAINAQDAMPDGGLLCLETGVAELDRVYAASHDGVTPGTYVLLAVSDTGRGMDEEMRAHLFEPFYTTKAKGKGTGLGLATVYGIVKQHGGHIWAYGESGQGMSFKIYLPLAAPEAPQAVVEPTEVPNLRGRETILLVEDDDMVRSLAQTLLSRQGYRVHPASGGEEALEFLARHPEVDLLLTDVVMPRMNGRALYAAASQRVPGLRVLFMSGYTENVIAHQGVLDEGIHFLPKPFSAQDLATKVREALGRG